MLRFLHCSDLLVGHPFPHAYRRADELRRLRLEALSHVIARARGEDAEFILLCGNTLADNRISPREIRELARVLQSSKVPVYVLPGQTDPLTPDSPYRLQAELFKSPVQILSEPQAVDGRGFRLHPLPARTRNQPTEGWMNVIRDPAKIEIGMACAEPEAWSPGSSPFDYVAMGGGTVATHLGVFHWSGAPESIDFGQQVGQVLLVTLGGAGEPPQVEPIETGRRSWLRWIRTFESVDVLLAELESVSNPRTVLLQLTLNGSATVDALETLAERLAMPADRFYLFELRNELELAPLQGDVFENPMLRGMIKHLAATAYGGTDPKLGKAAILELGQLVRNSGQEDLI